MTCLEWSLPFQCHRTELSCEIWSADFLALLLLSKTDSKQWPHHLEVTSSKWLFPLLTIKNAVSCQSPIVSIFFNENMKFSHRYFLLFNITFPSVAHGRPGFCNLHLQRLGFTVTIRDQVWYTGSERATLVKLMISRKKGKKKKGNSELFPLFSYHSRFWEINKICVSGFFSQISCQVMANCECAEINYWNILSAFVCIDMHTHIYKHVYQCICAHASR